MIDDFIEMISLGENTSHEYDDLKGNKVKHNKIKNELFSKSKELAKEKTCLYCGKESSSFCNSHSIPAFLIRNIAVDGDVFNTNKLVNIAFSKDSSGVKSSGTFKLICRDCDSTIFKEYESPENYSREPTGKMLAQIAMKNYMRFIYKRKVEIQLYKLITTQFNKEEKMFEQIQIINQLDLDDFVQQYQRAKRVANKNWENEYYMFFNCKLDYIVPIAFQGAIALLCDLNEMQINDIYYTSPKYKIQYLHISIFPLEDSSRVFMFIDKEHSRYRSFYKAFKKLSKNEKLEIVNYIVFSYSEDIFINKNIDNIALINENLIEASRKSTYFMSPINDFNAYPIAKQNFNFECTQGIPNLLSEQYKL
jgi:hypothetical protein